MRTVEDKHTFNHKYPLQTHARTHTHNSKNPPKFSQKKIWVVISSCEFLQIEIPFTKFWGYGFDNNI